MPLIKEVLLEAKKLVTPSREEQNKINSIVKEVSNEVTKEITKQKLSAKIFAGGSVAKGTWLPGLSDMDFFILFNYDRYSERSTDLSDMIEKVLKKIFTRIQRLHGSRDYFAAKYKGFNL